jgi:SAM-dependent methyltransferase
VRTASAIALEHLERIRTFYDAAATEPNWAARAYRELLARYYNLIIPAGASVLEIGCGSGELLRRLHAGRKVGVDVSPRQIDAARRRVPSAEFHVQAGETITLTEPFDYIVVSDTLNFAADVQLLLERLHAVSHANTRLVVNYYSSLWRPVLSLAHACGLKSDQPQSSWLGRPDVRNLLRLADWSQISEEPRLLVPATIVGLERVINRWMSPVVSPLCLTVFSVSRPSPRPSASSPRVSVIIPARNEAGNIEAAVLRTPEMGAGTELVFVEGHSHDDTWTRIERVARDHPERAITILRQPGAGKGDAVRAGCQAATGDVLMILDADLTMPPEELPKFYDVLVSGKAELANGVRLVYPMDDKAMRWMNLVANKTFSLIFTWLLGQSVKDTLCGTKALTRAHYERIRQNRAYFGDFDPFGDFDLLFGAAKLKLAIADVPIRYRERTYGTTNIRRWRHGWLLLRMILVAARTLRFV